MQFIVTIRHLGKILAIGVLLAVPTLGLARLSADFFASWQGRSSEEAILASNPTDGLLAFNAPESTLRQYQLRVKDSSSTTGQGDKSTQPSLLVEDWRFTAQTADLTPLIQGEFFADLALVNAGVPSNVVSAVMFQQFFTNQAVLRELSAVSQAPLNVPMINGFIGNLVVSQLIFDNWLISNGVSPSAMVLLLGQQLSFNEVITQWLLSAAQPNVQPTPLQPASPSS